MDEQEARLALLQAELSSVESSIRAFDTIAFQVKGWCVTATLAIAGFAANEHRILLTIGFAAVLGFWMVDSQNRYIQRRFISRNKHLRQNLRANGLMTVLDGGGSIPILGSPDVFAAELGPRPSRLSNTIRYARGVLHEALLPHTLGLYLFLIACLGVQAVFV
jgi:hypothetical protein